MIQVINRKQGSNAFGRIENASHADLQNEWFVADGWELYENNLEEVKSPPLPPELPQDIESSDLIDYTNIPEVQESLKQLEEDLENTPINPPMDAKPKYVRPSRRKAETK